MDQSHWARGNDIQKKKHMHTQVWSVTLVLPQSDHSCPSVCQIQGDKVKLSFSMKAVNQGTGQDLDPNNVMAE